MEIILPTEGSHWYTPTGEPCHEVPRKSGGGMRAVNMRRDRNLGLFPSVTNIIGIKHKEGLEAYKIKQAIMSCLTLPRIDDEALDGFAKRVVQDMGVHREKAAEFGTRVHHATEAFHRHLKDSTLLCQIDEEVQPYIEDYKRWLIEYIDEVLDAEIIIVNPVVGYAGTVDLCARRRVDHRLVVIDTKTQGIKKGNKGVNKKPNIYDTWLLQLRAYGQTFIQDKPLYISVVINSAEPSPAIIHEWPESDYRAAWRAFLACHYLWCYDKNYWPTRYWQ